MIRRIVGLMALLLSALTCGAQEVERIRVGIVSDGPTDRDIFPVAMLEREAKNVLGTDVAIVFPTEGHYTGDWSLAGVERALDRALADSEIDVVLTIGVLASHQAAHRERLAKPVIAPVVIDPVLQGYPLVEGRSGRRNFTYVADFQGFEEDMRLFREAVSYKHVAVLVDETLLRALPELNTKATQVATTLGVRVTIVSVSGDAALALAALPADVDAVYVAGLLR